MRTNFVIEEIGNHYGLSHMIIMKNKLEFMHWITIMEYFVSTESSIEDKETHWLAFKIENDCWFYFNDYGRLFPEEIIKFYKKMLPSRPTYNTYEIQD